MQIVSKGKKENAFKIMFRSFSFLGGQRKRYLVGWFLSCAEFAIAFITPYMYKQLVEIVTNNRNEQVIRIVNLLFIALVLLAPVVCLGAYLRYTSAAIGVGNAQKAVFNHLEHLPVLRTIENKKGDYITRLSNDASTAVGMFQGYAITGFFKFLIYFTVSFILLARISYLLLGISLLFSTASFISATKLNPKARGLEREARKYTSETASYLVEAFRCMPIIRVFLLRDRMIAQYREVCMAIMQKRIKFRMLLGVAYCISNTFCYAVQPVGFIVGIVFMMKSHMDVAQIIFATSVMAIMADGLREFGTFTQFIQSGIVASRRVFEVLDDSAELEGETVNPVNPLSEQAIVLKDVRFSYHTGEEVLKGINLTIRRGETVAVVGGSGGGKTTLLKLLQGLYTKSSGEISLFGTSIDEMSLADIRGLSSYVQQDCVLFDGSIAENIGLGVSKFTTDDIADAAKRANLGDFIASLPGGMNTQVGERGAMVSGGQKQRITIARAILKNTPILLLDEATSALDSQAENEVHTALEELVKGRTTIIVAHRLSTVQNADKIIVIEDGVIEEEGTHSELMLKDGRYQELVNAQLKS
jgi:ABC-type multidrug transport system fused ATPase/permease subunit